MKTELINLESMKLQPAALFTKGGLDKLLEKIETEARALVPDAKTAKGRKEIASNAARIPRSKTYLDELGKNLTADLKAQTKAVDVERKGMRDRLDALKVEVRKPLTEWEDAEKARVAAITSKIDDIRGFASTGDEAPYTAAQLAETLANLEATEISEWFAEFVGEAVQAKQISVFALKEKLARRETYEAEQAELERLRKEKEARDEADRVEQIKREATAKAQKAADERAERDREAAENKLRNIQRRAQEEQDAETARLNADRRAAEQRAYEAEGRAERAAKQERERIEEQQREKEAAERKRERNKAHRAVIEGDAIEGLMVFGLSREQAGAVVVAIRMGQVPNVIIQY